MLNMAAFTFFAVIICFSFCGSSSACYFVPEFNLLDCANMGLQATPDLKKNEKVVTVTLRDNNIKFINFTSLLLALPNIKTVIVTGNPLNCIDVCNIGFVNVISDCICTIPTLTSTKSSVHSTTTSTTTTKASTITYKTSTPITNFTTTSPITNFTTSPFFNSRMSSESLYVVIIVPCLLFVLLVLLLVSLVRKCRNHRASIRLLEELQMNDLLIEHVEDDDDEDVLFDRQNYLQNTSV